MTFSVIIAAAGEGKRFGRPKAFVRLEGKTLLEWSLLALTRLDDVGEIVVVCRREDREAVNEICGEMDNIMIVDGGDSRADSVRRGFEVTTGKVVVVHNVANPLATSEDFQNVLGALDTQDTVFCGRPVVDTLRKVSEDTHIRTFDRTDVWLVQTPQAFKRESLDTLYRADRWKGITDEIQGTEQLGFSSFGVVTGRENVKVTVPEDLAFLRQMLGGSGLVGIGEDSHAFSDRGKLVLGGVGVDDCKALKGESDADVILHALFNAVSSAMGHGSLGSVADEMAKRGVVDSKEYVRIPLLWMRERGYRLKNMAFSLECSVPKIDPLVDRLKESLSRLTGVETVMIGITATSGEGLTAFGKGEGIRCSCAVQLTLVDSPVDSE